MTLPLLSPLETRVLVTARRFRDLVATGFFTSRMGIDDLKYIGNVPNPMWDGCPDQCYTHLGVTKA